MTVQILILLLFKTKTPTTGGLTTVFDQRPFGLDPTLVLFLSTSWSLLSCVRMHTKLIAIEKGFCKITSKFFIFLWGTFATLRRVLSLVAFFTPSMGLFSLLHHWEWEQVTFSTLFTDRSDFKIRLYGLNKTIYWSEVDNFDYSNPKNPIPPPVSSYTFWTLRQTFTWGVALLTLHIILILVVKILTSDEFKKRENYTDKLVHILDNVNYASPFSDWDVGEHSIQEFQARYCATIKEMLATLSINLIVTLTMMGPLLYTGKIKNLTFKRNWYQRQIF